MRYLIFLFACLSVFGDFEDPNVLASTEGDPSANPCPYVSSLTGEFISHEVDLVVNSVEPITVQRHFTGNRYAHDVYLLWTSFPQVYLKLFQVKVIQKNILK